MARHIPRRAYRERPDDPARLQDRDAAAAAFRLKTAYYAGAGAVIGGLGGAFKFGPLGFVAGAALGYGVVFYLTKLFVEGGGALMGKIYHPHGESTPHKREYSEAQALALRGLFQEAIDCYETYVAEFPDDPEPYMGIARVYRDHLKRYDDAATWFRRARQAAGIDRGRELLVTREIIEVYMSKLRQPERAIPELARLADRFSGTREGDLAKVEIERIRAERLERPQA